VFTGPHGAGRKTVAEMLGSTLNMKQVLSQTTRPQRPTEVDGQDYFFITPEQFADLEKQNELIEVNQIGAYRYGIKNADLEKMLQSAGTVYLILNRYGAETLKKIYQDRVTRIFIYANVRTLEERMRGSGDSDELIQQYLASYEEEMAYRHECEYVIENFDSSHTVYDLTKKLDLYLKRNLLDLD
jgi:guanylate kinase